MWWEDGWDGVAGTVDAEGVGWVKGDEGNNARERGREKVEGEAERGQEGLESTLEEESSTDRALSSILLKRYGCDTVGVFARLGISSTLLSTVKITFPTPL